LTQSGHLEALGFGRLQQPNLCLATVDQREIIAVQDRAPK
jgi:hypothetical protein